MEILLKQTKKKHNILKVKFLENLKRIENLKVLLNNLKQQNSYI